MNKTDIKNIVVYLILPPLFVIFMAIAGYRNVEITKQHAESRWKQAGYIITGYEGYQWTPLGGGAVWYILRKEKDNGITYSAFLEKWGDEYHIYALKAVDAIKP